ncbi:MAG: cyclic nucleotide-binding domain-containing protein [Bradymonadaceae bacterium]
MTTTIDRTAILGETTVFSALSETNRRALSPVFKIRELEAGEILFREGDAGDYLAIVVDGELVVEISGEKRTTEAARLRPHEVVGEMSCLDPKVRSATVTATQKTTVLTLTRMMLDSLKVNAPPLFAEVVAGLARRVTERIRETNEDVAELLRKNRAPTRTRQPSLQVLADDGRRSQGEPYQGPIELTARGALAEFSGGELDMLRGAARAQRFGAGKILCREGRIASTAFVIVAGEVDISRRVGSRRFGLATVGQGGVIGQLALLDHSTRSATVSAVNEVIALELDRATFDALLGAHSPMAIRFQEIVTRAGIRQLRQANEMLSYMAQRELAKTNPRIPIPEELVFPSVDFEGDDTEDIESLAAAYLETALQNWDVTPSEIKNIRVMTPSGQLTQAEINARNKT